MADSDKDRSGENRSTEAPTRALDWYKTTIDLMKYEVEHGRARFFESMKIHVGVIGGLVAIEAFLLERVPDGGQCMFKVLVSIVCVLGAFNAIVLGVAMMSAQRWEATWLEGSATIEETPEFRAEIGVPSVAVFTSSRVRDELNRRLAWIPSYSRIHQLCLCVALVFAYGLVALALPLW